MKLQWIALLAGVLLSAPLAAQNTVQTAPQEVRTPLYYLERQLKVWKLDRIEPLSQTIPSPFAKGAWRASLTRPFDTAPVEGMPDPLGKRKMKNLAEFILIPKKAGNSADRVRPRLLWKNNVNEVYSPIAFLGEDRGYLWFGKADILTLHWTRKTLGLTRGENLAELFADALNREDENNFTRRSASIILQDYGDAAIPPIRRAIGLALADHEPIRLHLQALKNIGTPLAAKELVRSLQSGNAEAYAALTDVLAVPPFLKEAREAYFVMAGRHDILPGAIEAAIQYKWEKDFLQVLRKIVRRPLSFREYMVVRTTIDQFETGKKESPELAAMEQIKILLMRSGDVAGTPRILSLSDKELEVKRKLEKEDRKRIQPFEDQLAKSKNPEMAVLAALSLYIMEWDTLRMRRAGNSAGTAPVSRDYLRRVKEAGLRILKRLDSDTVQRTLTTLKNHVESEDESNMLSSLAARLSGRYGKGGER